jgi:hypothetical protein
MYATNSGADSYELMSKEEAGKSRHDRPKRSKERATKQATTRDLFCRVSV